MGEDGGLSSESGEKKKKKRERIYCKAYVQGMYAQKTYFLQQKKEISQKSIIRERLNKLW